MAPGLFNNPSRTRERRLVATVRRAGKAPATVENLAADRR